MKVLRQTWIAAGLLLMMAVGSLGIGAFRHWCNCRHVATLSLTGEHAGCCEETEAAHGKPRHSSEGEHDPVSPKDHVEVVVGFPSLRESPCCTTDYLPTFSPASAELPALSELQLADQIILPNCHLLWLRPAPKYGNKVSTPPPAYPYWRWTKPYGRAILLRSGIMLC